MKDWFNPISLTSFEPPPDGHVAEFVRGKIGEVVKDPAVAEKLKPRGYPIFARRPCLDTSYYDTFNLPKVHLVDCFSDPIIIRISEHDVDWIAAAMVHMDKNGLASIEPTQMAENGWMDIVFQISQRSLILEAKSWWVGADVKDKPQGQTLGFAFEREKESVGA